jgi:carboxyl-terminal processing protease
MMPPVGRRLLIAAGCSVAVPALARASGFDWARLAERAQSDHEDLAIARQFLRDHHLHALGAGDLDAATVPDLVDRLKEIDPYIELLPPVAATDYQQADAVVGVGLKLLTEGSLLLAVIHDGGPLARQGFEHAHVLRDLEGRPTQAADYDWAVSRFQSADTQSVRLMLEALETGIARGTVVRASPYPVRTASLRTDLAIPIIRIVEFVSGHTYDTLRNCLECIDPRRPLVLDLRYATGGNLEETVRVAGLFLGPDRLVYQRADREARKARRQISAVTDRAAIRGHSGPLAVLTGPSTASAAEVLSRALMTGGVCTAIGTFSFGKCVAQRVFPLASGRRLRFSTDTLYGPDGTPCDMSGNRPDLEIPVARVHKTFELIARLRQLSAFAN